MFISIFSVTNSPSLGLSSESLAQVMIISNDIANGALELSPISVNILENVGSTGVKLTRRGGTFGQVQLFMVILSNSKPYKAEKFSDSVSYLPII
jgi:hypothetical protein